MTDQATTISELKHIVKRICEEREWDQFHTHKDIAIGIVTEAGELLENFRGKSNEEASEMMKDPLKAKAINDELSDVFYWTLRFAQKYEIDLSTAFKSKMADVEKKYPVGKSKGSNKKYTEL